MELRTFLPGTFVDERRRRSEVRSVERQFGVPGEAKDRRHEQQVEAGESSEERDLHKEQLRHAAEPKADGGQHERRLALLELRARLPTREHRLLPVRQAPLGDVPRRAAVVASQEQLAAKDATLQCHLPAQSAQGRADPHGLHCEA